jgi:hypothetical protein
MMRRHKPKTASNRETAIRDREAYKADLKRFQKRFPANAKSSINNGRGRVTAAAPSSGCSSSFAAIAAL